MIFTIFEILTSYLEIFLLYATIQLIYPRKNALKYNLLCSTLLMVIVLLLNNIILFSILPLLFFPIFISITSMRIYHCRFYYAFSISMFYCLVIYLIDFITTSAISLLTGNYDYMTAVTTQMGIQRLAFISITKIILLVLFFIIKRFIKVNQQNMELYKSLFIISIMGFLGSLFFIVQTFESFNIHLAMSWILLTLTVSLLLVLMIIYLKYRNEININNILVMRNELSEKNYLEVKSLYQTNSKLFHDFNHHVHVLQDMVEKREYEKLEEYVKDLNSPFINMQKTSWTEHSVIDFILNSKIQEGEKASIRFSINAEFPSHSGIRSHDITIILSNLMDNAIEACKRIEDSEKRYIEIVLRKINDMIFIKTKNSCYHPPYKKNERFISTKRDSLSHGWGLMSVENTAKKYNGTLQCHYDENQNEFISVVNLVPMELNSSGK